MITTIDISLLPKDLQKRVLEKYRVALMDPDRPMTYEECAWLYGFTYQTLRSYVKQKRIRTVGRFPLRRITHAAMRQYFQSKRIVGAPRKAQREAQLQLG